MKRFALILVLAVAPLAFAQDAGAPAAQVVTTTDLPDGGTTTVTLPANAPPTVNMDQDGAIIAAAKTGYDLVMHKDWGKLVFLIVTVLVWLSRTLAKKFSIGWLSSGGAAIVKAFALSFSGALAGTWAAGTHLTLSEVTTALQMGFAAAGGWSIIEWVLTQLASKWDWAKWLAGVVLGVEKVAGLVPAAAPAVPPKA